MIQKIKVDEIFVLAERHHKKNNFIEAQKLYESIIKIEPNHLESIFRLGSLFAQINSFDKAINFLSKVIKIEPNHSKAHNNLGIVFNSLRQYQKAKYYYEKAIEINPKHEEAYNNLGSVFFELSKFENAVKCYHEAIEINSNNHDAIKNISILFRQVSIDVFASVDRERLRTVKPLIDEAFGLALRGEYWKAMSLNGLIIASSIDKPVKPAIEALATGALASGFSGTGTATAAVCMKEDVDLVYESWSKIPGKIIESVTNIKKAEVIS